jgi:glyoxylase-like metal-dependent hydrolase (beta-lactamase superfamily II)
MAPPRVNPESAVGHRSVDFVCLRRYSSFFPFVPRPSAFHAPGGGYFLYVDGPEPFGLVIDPGPNFIVNLYRCGYSLRDVRMVAVTHDHADHMADLDALLTLIGYRDMLRAKDFDAGRQLLILGNESVYERYRFFNDHAPIVIDGKKKVRSDFVTVMTFEQYVSGTKDATRKREQCVDLPPEVRIEPIVTGGHTDAHGYIAQGFRVIIDHDGTVDSIVFSSDTVADPEALEHEERQAAGVVGMKEAMASATIVVAHVSAVGLSDLRRLARFREGPPGAASLIAEFRTLWTTMVELACQEDNPSARAQGFLLSQLNFGFRTETDHHHTDEQVALGTSPLDPLGVNRGRAEKHLYLDGILKVARAMTCDDRHRLLVVGELREELGTFRTRIAAELNENVFRDSTAALTGDIGLTVRLTAEGSQVLCSTCELDNDLVAAERFHAPRIIREVCVKGEEEGIFYNCRAHDPGRRSSPAWLQAVERYDLFAE